MFKNYQPIFFSLIKKYGGIEYARKKAEELVNKGISKLDVSMIESREKRRILDIARYFTTRKE